MHRLGLLMSGNTSQVSLLDSNQSHQPEYTSIIPQESTVPFSASIHHPYNEQNSTNPISLEQYLKRKKIKKRSIDKINESKDGDIKDSNNKYSLSKDNIESKIFHDIKHKKEEHHLLLKSLKDSISNYENLKNKNSREGIEALSKQANLLAKLHDDFNKNNSENFSNEIKIFQN